MSEWIAERKLTYSAKGADAKNDLIIRIGKPYFLEPGMVDFQFDEGTAGCAIEFSGIEGGYLDQVYGADSIQALQLASDIEPTLRRFSRKYDFFFPTGEPYFEGEDEIT